ncbi:thermonuclease family protein [Hydrogenophaga sp.]|uniref:thermonuclease family protein n=1 Tax=Hydrogenophaga sp. TaxID=1904254 RepID=UPI00199759D2|nr:thermonuclease family protein [Hydrogenophaga sp.]MBD3893952.1 thermonuclease family protein [Hydrogenophaga sp.]
MRGPKPLFLVCLLACLLAALLLAPVSASAKTPPVYAARVTWVVDGDTLWARPLSGGRAVKLRLHGIDAPEICQAGGPVARAALSLRAHRQVVQVRTKYRDRYGRAVVQLHQNNEDLAASMVRAGQAWSDHSGRSLGPYAAEEAQARVQRRGLFQQRNAEIPRDFRRRHGPCPRP